MHRILNKGLYISLFLVVLSSCGREEKIDRFALVSRNNPHVTEVNPLHSLNLGNGEFSVTLDATGLQTFPEFYKDGLSLGTYSEWGWHSFPNDNGYSEAETLEDHPLPGHPHGLYAVQKGNGRSECSMAASEWIRANPHRLHLGNIGFEGVGVEDIGDVNQTLDLWNGELVSEFKLDGTPVSVRTVSGGEGEDAVAASISTEAPFRLAVRFPYPSGVHTDDASVWDADNRHSTEVVEQGKNRVVLKRILDETIYFVLVSWKGKALFERGESANKFILCPENEGKKAFEFVVSFARSEEELNSQSTFASVKDSSRKLWNNYWNTTGVVDFSHCTDPRAALLERRVILSQYLIRSQEAQNFPPAETGLTYNSWYGKFHLEMVMWHSFHYATWGKPELLEKQLNWYLTALPMAKKIAERQGFEGVRWMKMTDPSAREAPSDVGSFIIWQ